MGITGGFTSHRPESVKTRPRCWPCAQCKENHACAHRTLKRWRCKLLAGDNDPGWDNVVRAAEEDR